MKMPRFSRVYILLVCAFGLSGCAAMRFTGPGPCYGFGCPSGVPSNPPRVAANGQPGEAVATAQAQPQTAAPAAENSAPAKPADSHSKKHGLLAKLHLTHGD